jgi:thiol:disulfide interchange protein DsbD
MKKFFFLLTLLCSISLSHQAQILRPVSWSFDKKKISNTEYELLFLAKINKGWHIYSQFLESDQGPVATTFTFENSPRCSRTGKVTENPAPKTEYDPNFEMKVAYFENRATFTQRIKITPGPAFTLKGTLNFMTCEEGRCLPPEDVEFSFQLPETAADGIKATPAHTETEPLSIPLQDTQQVVLAEQKTAAKITRPSSTEKKKESSWGIFLAGFLGGFLALLTPCVFPMIPLTVSFFTKQSGNRQKGIINALIYAVSIVAIYVGIGLAVTFSLGPDALNALASNGFMNLAFFVIFMVFAASFLGAFEITLPSSWVNRADQRSEKGGLLGIFFLAFTLSLVSFSCTGPIIGTLLVQAAVGGNVLNPALGMMGFSMALALPFGLFAAFPGWLNTLPKSGGWLNSVKVFLGFLELALGLKFLSNVDLAYHWGILTREAFIALWIVIFLLLGLYLLGKFKLSHDSEVKHVSVGRLMLSILVFSFVVYLVPGMWGAPLKMISGFPPPTFYTEGWNLSSSGAAAAGGHSEVIPGTDPEHCPHNLNCFHDYEAALAYARKIKKPLMVDFTGWSCVNCRKMEDKVWVEPQILEKLRDKYVLVSLYVDDKTELPEKEKRVSTTTGRKIKTLGNKWSDLQTERYATNTQPFYVLLNNEEKLLNIPSGYNPDAAGFNEFLQTGIDNFATGVSISK